MTLPQDLANLLGVAIRDIIWYKDKVLAFLKDCGVPDLIMIDVSRMRRRNEPTLKLIQYVLNELDEKGAEGWPVARRMLTEMYYWKDVHTIEPERKDRAITSLKELQKAYDKYKAQREFQEQQQLQEKQMHEERLSRSGMRPLNHSRLEEFRKEFDEIWALTDAQLRGDRFEDLLNRVFDYYSEKSSGSFRRSGEQIDGSFYFDKHWHYVEIRWRAQKAAAADISVLRDRAKDAYGGDTKALFISFNGFTTECLECLQGKGDERVILMDGVDLWDVLNCDIAFDVLIAEKQADIVQNKRPFISSRDILKKRRGEQA